jgi:hypothetical protein
MRLVVLITLVTVGCGRAAPYPTGEAGPAPETIEADFAEAGGAARSESGDGALPDEGALGRKIIYTADVDLVVEQFDPIPDKVEALATQFGGYLASSNVSGLPGYPRTGQWKLRIPVERYQEFLAAARELGEVQRVRVDSQDVTEEFYDVEARIRNKKKEEERLLQLLETATGELEDILAVERELSRVREEVERVEGRLRVLKDLTSLTTVNLNVTEVKDYVPEEAATYATRVRRAFQSSITALVATVQALSIAVIVVAPWLLTLIVVLGTVLALFWLIIRRLRPAPALVKAERVEEV